MVIPVRKETLNEQNIALSKLGNKKLISWTIDEALNIKLVDKIIISTNDEILINTAEKYASEWGEEKIISFN